MSFSSKAKLLRRIPGAKKGWELFDAAIRKSVDIALDLDGKNLEREAQRRALRDTAEYIEAEMAGITSYGHRHQLFDRALEAVELPGLFLEFGVFQGKSINYLADRSKHQIYGFDSFEGLPEYWRDGLSQGHFKVPQLPAVRANVSLIKGWFKDTLPPFLAQQTGDVAFLHVDCDLYSSTKTVFDLLAPRLVKGTVIVFDDYFNYPGWRQGEFKAFREFCEAPRRQYEFLGYCRYGEQVAVRLK